MKMWKPACRQASVEMGDDSSLVNQELMNYGTCQLTRPALTVQAPVLNRFRQVFGPDAFAVGKISNGTTHF